MGRKESLFIFLGVLVVLLPRLRCGHRVWGLQGGFSSSFKTENHRPHIHKGLDLQGVSKHQITSELFFHVCVCLFVCYTVKYLFVQLCEFTNNAIFRQYQRLCYIVNIVMGKSAFFKTCM